MPGLERRKFVRHPVDVPLEYQLVGSNADVRLRTAKDLSVGGISFRCTDPPPIGSRIKVIIPTTQPPFEAEAVVVRTSLGDEFFEVGVAFESGHVWFRARMIEQICYIEEYRRDQEAGGRPLAFAVAAEEWIAENAESFGRHEVD